MKVLFISDIHLGARYMGDTRAHEARVVNFLRNEAHDADSLYLLGDILDYWFEYRNVVPRGFIRFFGELAALSDAGVETGAVVILKYFLIKVERIDIDANARADLELRHGRHDYSDSKCENIDSFKNRHIKYYYG